MSHSIEQICDLDGEMLKGSFELRGPEDIDLFLERLGATIGALWPEWAGQDDDEAAGEENLTSEEIERYARRLVLRNGEDALAEKPAEAAPAAPSMPRDDRNIALPEPPAPAPETACGKPLTQAETRVYDLLRSGVPVKQIAARFGVSDAGVYAHKANIARKGWPL